jgi:hypothetical protein
MAAEAGLAGTADGADPLDTNTVADFAYALLGARAH